MHILRLFKEDRMHIMCPVRKGYEACHVNEEEVGKQYNYDVL